MKTALVCGAGGFIGGHLVKRLKQDGFWVRGVDLKYPRYSETEADDFIIGDLRDIAVCREAIDRRFDEVYQLAADMGGAGYIFTGENDADIMHNSAHDQSERAGCVPEAQRSGVSSIHRPPASIRPTTRKTRTIPTAPKDSAYPAAPDSEYGWEKLFSERLYLAYSRNHGMQRGSRASTTSSAQKAPGTAEGKSAGRDVPQGRDGGDGGTVEIWGDGEQTRSFLYVDECLEGTLRLMRSDYAGPVNIGSEEMVTINQLAHTVCADRRQDICMKQSRARSAYGGGIPTTS